MTDVLGPCPVCGCTDSPLPNGHDDTVWCVGVTCRFECTREHWSLLRRKMTREEGAAIIFDLGTLVQCAFDAGSSSKFGSAKSLFKDSGELKARVFAALTGEKT